METEFEIKSATIVNSLCIENNDDTKVYVNIGDICTIKFRKFKDKISRQLQFNECSTYDIIEKSGKISNISNFNITLDSSSDMNSDTTKINTNDIIKLEILK